MPNHLKIAIVSPVLPEQGGIGAVAANQARLLSERGQEVVLLTPDYGYRLLSAPHPSCAKASEGRPTLSSGRRGDLKIPSPFKGEGQGEGSERNDFKSELLKPILKYGNAAWVPSLGERLRGFDTVILHYPFFGGAGAVYRARKKYGFKLVVYYHMDVVGAGLKKIIFDYNTNYFLPRLIERADMVLSSSEDYAKHSHLKKFWQSSEKFQVLPIGVDIKKFVPSIVSREKIILFVGVLDAAHYFKGVEYLIRAVSIIHQNDFKLIIVGSGDLLPAYQKLARDLSVSDKIIFAGKISGEQLAQYFQKALVTVLPSIDSSEAFGIVLLESMSCATPVIATNLPGVRSVYEDKVSGFTVPIRDSKALAEKIEYLLSNPEKAANMGAAGRNLVEEKYDWEKIGDKLLEFLISKF